MTDVFDFSTFPTLTRERLVLRELSPDDAADLFVWRRDPVVQRYNSEPMQTVAEAGALIDELRREYATETAIHWAVTLRDDGRGIATEALDALLQFGFGPMRLNRIGAQTIADNHESGRLLQRLGFQRDGRRRSYSLEEDGTFHDGAIYGLLRDEYPPPPLKPACQN